MYKNRKTLVNEVTLFELTSIVSFLDKYNISKECEKELLTAYYQAMEIAKINGDWNVVINITDKCNLVEFLNYLKQKKLSRKKEIR